MRFNVPDRLEAEDFQEFRDTDDHKETEIPHPDPEDWK